MAAIDELIDELREAARYLERRGIDRGCQDSSLSAGLANRAADTIETLSSPASSSPAEAEALPDGVEAVRAVSDTGKRWRIVPVDGDWEMQPVGHITAGQAERLCKAIEAALVDGGQPVPDRDGADGTERLCRALYGRKAATRDYLGGSDARMLHDAADRLASLSPAPAQAGSFVASASCPQEPSGVEKLRAALREANAALASAFNRIHGLPRTADTELAQRLGSVRAQIAAVLKEPDHGN